MSTWPVTTATASSPASPSAPAHSNAESAVGRIDVTSGTLTGKVEVGVGIAVINTAGYRQTTVLESAR